MHVLISRINFILIISSKDEVTMRFKWNILRGIIFVFLILSGCLGKYYITDGNAFVSKKYGFSIELPERWEYSEEFSEVPLPEKEAKEQGISAIFVFHTTKSGIKDPLSIGLLIAIEPTVKDFDKKKWLEYQRSDSTAYKGKEYFSGDIILSGYLGIRYIGSTTYPDTKIFGVFDTTVIKAGDKAYTVKFSVPEEYYSDYKDMFDRSVRSFKILR